MIGSKLLAFSVPVAGILCLQTGVTAQSSLLVDAVAHPGCVEVTVAVPPPELARTRWGDELFVPGFGRFGEPGAPELPGRIFSIAVPPGAWVTDVTVTPLATTSLPGRYDIPVTPLPRLIGAQQGQVAPGAAAGYQANLERIYGADDPYPSTAGHFVGTAGYRKYDLVDVYLTPVSYRPRSRSAVHHSRIAIRVDHSVPADAAFRPDDLAGPERTARGIVLNYEQAQLWYSGRGGVAERGLHDFVIIALDSLVPAVQPLVDWETWKGRNVKVVTTTWINRHVRGYDLAERMRNFLRARYPSSVWGIEDVLLVGHYDDLPIRQTEQDTGYGKPATDYYYAELSKPDDLSWDKDGDHKWGEHSDPVDFYNEVIVGRIPWSEPEIVRNVCERSVAFENTNDPAYKQSILLLGAFLWPTTDTAVMMEAKVAHRWMADWSVTRMYEEGHSVYPCDLDLDFNNLWATWSTGEYAFVNWAGHGWPTVARLYYGYGHHMEPFVNCFTSRLTADDHPSIVFALACSNADSDYDNIAREMLGRSCVGFCGANKPAWARPKWDAPNDGGSATLDYLFTKYVTSADHTQGEAHARAMTEMYTHGWWMYPKYDRYVWWGLMGNPDLGLEPVAPITIELPDGLPEGCLRPGPATPLTLEIHDGVEYYVPGSGLLHYRIDPSAPFSSVAVTSLGGDRYEATLPPTRGGDQPEFYFEARSDGGVTVRSPLDAPARVHSFDVGFVELLLRDDFEEDTGWRVESENSGSGAWERVDPAGTVAQPEDDHTRMGSLCYVTGGGGGVPGADDVDGPATRLISPTIDLSAADATLSFQLWFFHGKQAVSDPLFVHLSNDDGASWTEIDQVVESQGWTRMDYTVSDHLAPTSTVRIRLTASDDHDDGVVEAAVDDFEIERYEYDPSLWADAYAIPAATGGAVDLTLAAGAAHRGLPYVVLGSLSGTSPGFDFNGVHVPLNWDWFTFLTLSLAGSPWFVDFQGRLDSSGEAVATFDTQGPVESDLVGLGASFAYVTLSPEGFASNAVTVQLEE